jgi:hypothetical protein
MNRTEQILKNHPRRIQIDPDALLLCVNTCFDSFQTCTACADACLGEEDIHSLIRCIRLNQDCADVAGTTGRILVRLTMPDWSILRSQLQACADACHECAGECEQHRQTHDYCRLTMITCRECEEAVKNLLVALLTTAS